MVSLDSTVTRKTNILGANFGDEVILMSPENENYYELTATSRTIWDKIAEPILVRDLCVDLSQIYQAPLERIEPDVLHFLSHLQIHNMVELR